MSFAGLTFGRWAARRQARSREDRGDRRIPEWFLAQPRAHRHEVGHTLGLRHNFKASSIYSLAKINSPELKGKQPFAGSVMDYLPINVVLNEKGELQGDIDMLGIGPYDMWAIEYGYTFDDTAKVLARVRARVAYATDGTRRPGPPRPRYDAATRWLAESRMKFTGLRAQILDKFVKAATLVEGAWGYKITLGTQSARSPC
jgi:hypothetical protein